MSVGRGCIYPYMLPWVGREGGIPLYMPSLPPVVGVHPRVHAQPCHTACMPAPVCTPSGLPNVHI